MGWLQEELKKKPNIFTKALSECVCSCFMVFIGLGSMATAFFKGGDFGISVQLAWAFGMTLAVYMGVRISAQLDPAISFMFFVLGHMSFGRFLLYFFAQTLGAFIAAGMTFGIYYDAINTFDNGTRAILEPKGTGVIFTSFPQPYLSITNGIFDQIAGTSLLCFSVRAIIDRNTAIPYYLHPLLIGLSVFTIASGYAWNGMGSINPARDFGPRLFLWVAGYSWKAISYNHYKWFWIPIVAPLIASVIGGYGYDILIGWHQPKISPELDPNRGQATLEPESTEPQELGTDSQQQLSLRKIENNNDNNAFSW